MLRWRGEQIGRQRGKGIAQFIARLSVYFYMYLFFESDILFLITRVGSYTPGPEVIKLVFMLNSAEHEILTAYNY